MLHDFICLKMKDFERPKGSQFRITMNTFTQKFPHLRCGHDTFGCDGDEDCLGGLECVGEGIERKCLDIDECTDPRYTRTRHMAKSKIRLSNLGFDCG